MHMKYKVLLPLVLSVMTGGTMFAFPSAEEFAAAEKSVQSVLAAELAAVESGETLLGSAAVNVEQMADKTKNEAERFLFLRTAIILFSRAGQYERASKLIMLLARSGAARTGERNASLFNDVKMPKAEGPLPEIEASPAENEMMLNGDQKAETVTLRSGAVYNVNGSYTVGKGRRLVIPEGVTLEFGKDCGLTVNGCISAIGSESKPIVMKGVFGSKSKWKGVGIRNSCGNVFEWVRITDADAGVDLVCSETSIRNCELVGNGDAVLVTGPCTGGVARVENSLIARNGIGISVLAAEVKVDHCMVSDNSQSGFWIGPDCMMSLEAFSRYRFGCRAEVLDTVVTRNGDGFYVGDYTSDVSVHGCAILGNQRCDVSSDATETNDFTGNWWGVTNTVGLIKNGDGWRGGSFKGEGLSVSGFLREYPKTSAGPTHLDF